MYGKNTRAASSSLCESPNDKYGTVYIGFWLSPKSHFPASHAFHALSLTSQWDRCSSFTKVLSYTAIFHKQDCTFYHFIRITACVKRKGPQEG